MIDYIDFLENRGFDCVPSGKNNIFISCPFHMEEEGSCGINLNTGGFHCFGCNESGSFAELIAHIDGIDVESARLLLDDDLDIINISEMIMKQLNNTEESSFKRFIHKSSFFRKFGPLTDKFVKYVESRKLNIDICNMFDIRAGMSGKWNDRIIIPFKNGDGKIVGFMGRAIYKNAFLPKRTFIAYEGALKDILYGLYENTLLIKQTKTILLVEGPIDAIYLSMLGFPAVARLGCNCLCDVQVSLLIKYADRVILSYDGDSSGIEGMQDTYDQLNKYLSVISVFLPQGKDPNTLSFKEINKLYCKKIFK